MDKRLYRSQTNKVVAGVCGGLGDYFEVDPVLVRIICVLLILATGFGLLAYIIGWVLIPKRETDANVPEPPKEIRSSSWNKYLPGMIMIGIGIILLVRENWYWFDWSEFWPVLLIAVGLVLIFRGKPKLAPADATDPAAKQAKTDANHNGGSST